MPPTSASPIAERSWRCSQLFDRLSSLLDDHTSSHPSSLAACLDEFGRFRLWANNIGAFLNIERRNSLEFRLREASKTYNTILEFLEDLSEALVDACSITSGTRPNRVAITPNISSSPGLEISEFSQIFDTVKDIITSLMQTSIIIRNATPRDRYIKAQSSAKNPFLESFDIAHVGHKFPKVDSEDREWLKRRLGTAISHRRQYLKYCREHHEKFSPSVEQDRVDSVLPSESKHSLPEPTISRDVRVVAMSEHHVDTVRSVPISALAPTDASTLQPSRLEVIDRIAEIDAEVASDSYSVTSYATSVQDDTSESKLHTPSLEDITRTFPFECPYCWTLQGSMNAKSWKKHVFADLRPYVCTFEECDLRLFADRHAWFNHEIECHRLNWCCHFCSHLPFKSKTGLSTHMRHRHAQFSSPAQLPALIEASRQAVDQIPAADCPLCHWEVSLRKLNTHTPSNETLVVTPEQFRRHLGAHMEQLALFALPRHYKDQVENADSNEAAAMTHSDFQSRHLSIGNMSWKTVSSREVTLANAIPDEDLSITHGTGPDYSWSYRSYPWTRQPFSMYCISLKRGKYYPRSFPRHGAAMCCSERGELYFQGGLIIDDTAKNNIWTIEASDRRGEDYTICWSHQTSYTGPGARVGHAALWVDGNIIVFGGDATGTTDKNSLDDALYVLKFGPLTWSTIIANARPSGRYGHTLNVLGSSILVFGGQNDGVFFNDLSGFDLRQINVRPDDTYWETLLPNEPHSARPLARMNHSMVSWDDKLYLFGGTNGKVCFNDLWHYSSQTGWTQVGVVGDYIPQSRESHAAVVLDDVMWVFGGRSTEGHQLGDLAGFAFEYGCWLDNIKPQHFRPSPSPRSGHQMAVNDHSIYMVGGEPSDGGELTLLYTLETHDLSDYLSNMKHPRLRTPERLGHWASSRRELGLSL